MKIKCINTTVPIFEKGKIYEFKDRAIWDREKCLSGNYYKSIDDWNSTQWDGTPNKLAKFELMEEIMTKDDLKVGYVVEYRVNGLAMVMPSRYGDIFISKEGSWVNSDRYNKELLQNFCNDGFDIMKVYGFSTFSMAYEINTIRRSLLWQREVPFKIHAKEVLQIVAKEKNVKPENIEILYGTEE